MSLYNTLMGVDPLAGHVLRDLGLHPTRDIARFRDAYLAEDGERLVIFTRLGGGNRADYQEAIERLRAHPHYLEDADDAWDSTFAYFYFRLPPDGVMAQIGDDLRAEFGRPPAGARYSGLVERMGRDGHKDDPDVKRAVDAGKLLLAPMFEALGVKPDTTPEGGSA